MTRLKWLKLIFLRYYRSMGLRVLLYALLSVAATLVSPFANAIVGYDLNADITFASVTPVLTILASSMLAVSTFSLSIMVSAHRAAANTATPRMHRILLEDTTTQSVLSVFIGAFVYSLGSLVLYRLGFYPEDAALVVMGITTLVVVAVILSLLRWINHLTTLGSLEDSLRSAQVRAEEALLAHARHPRFGASELTEDTVMPHATTPLCAPQSGYLQLIDMAMLQNCLSDQTTLYLDASPGQHVLVGDVIGQVAGTVDEAICHELLKAFTFGSFRTHEQDAEFGLVIISEIGLKALSPGLNDPGTAIEALMMLKTLLWRYALEKPESDAPTATNVIARFPGPSEFVEASFAQISRDCVGSFDVLLRLLECLAALSASDNNDLARAARALADRAISRAVKAGVSGEDLERLRSAAPKTTA
ncbi:DUF2254 domain-containing protein [uncultured Roseobacter sp.]|uniref:DUF2254 domain-containing protein n=1 Tax=uncultured Roseobacter sp. TaxID=114847 RepID=UPI002630A05F|nr:DUF2254 domain-containing protein [uncultured Roseobacter sp.]